MGTKFFSLKKSQKTNPENSFASLTSKKSTRKQLDPVLFNDASINQENFLDQHGSVSVIGFRNTDREISSKKTSMTNFLPAVGTYSSKVTPKIDPIPEQSTASQSSTGEFHNRPYRSSKSTSKSSINLPTSDDPYYRENIQKSVKNSPYSSPYRNRSIISTEGSSITHYFSYENQNPKTEQNISNSTKPNMSLNFDTSEMGSQIFDSVYNTQAIQEAERALTRNSKYPNGGSTSKKSRNSQYKYQTTINLENLEDIMRVSRVSTQNLSMQKALNDENMISSSDNSQLNLTLPRRKSNPRTSAKITDSGALEVPTTLQELPEEEQSDSDSFYDPLPILSRPGSDLDQSNSLTSPSERNEDTSTSSSHDLYEVSNNVNLDKNTPKYNSVKVDSITDISLPNSDFTNIKEDSTLNTSELRESGPSTSLNESSILNAHQDPHTNVNSNSLNFSDKNYVQSVNSSTEPPMPPPKPKLFSTNSPTNTPSKGNSTCKDISPLNIQTTSESELPLAVPPRPMTNTESNDKLVKENEDVPPQSPDQISEKPSFYLASDSLSKSKSNKAHSSGKSQDIHAPFPGTDISLGISNSTVEDSLLSLPSFLNGVMKNESNQIEKDNNPEIELESSELYDPFSLKKQIFEESELPEQVAKAESICNPSVINQKIEPESTPISCNESFDFDNPVFDESDLLPKSPKLEPITCPEIENYFEMNKAESRDIFDNRTALDESDLIPLSFEESNIAKITPITNSPITIDIAESESSSHNFNPSSQSFLPLNLPLSELQRNENIKTSHNSNMSEEVEFMIEKFDESISNDTKMSESITFPIPDPLVKESYNDEKHTLKAENEASLYSRELDMDNTSQKSRNSGKKCKFPEPIIPPSPIIALHHMNSNPTLLSPISKTKLNEDEFESGSDTTPQQKSFAIEQNDTTPKSNRSIYTALSSGNSSTSITSNIPPKTPKSATFGNRIDHESNLSDNELSDLYEKVRKMEEECIKYKEEIDNQNYLLNETNKLMVEEKESKVRAEYEFKKIKNQLEEANNLIEEQSEQILTAENELEEAKSEISELKKINEELSIQVESNSQLQLALDEAKFSISQLEKDIKNNEYILIEKEDKLIKLEKDHSQLQSNFNSISQDLEDLRRIQQQEWLNTSRNSSFINKTKARTGSNSSGEGRSKHRYSNRRSDTFSSSGDISRSIIFEESGGKNNNSSFQFTRDSTDTIIDSRKVGSINNNNNSDNSINHQEESNYYEEYQQCNERVNKLLKQIEGRDKQIAELSELIKSQSKAKSSALNNYNKYASRSMSQLSSSSSSSNKSIFENATLTIQKLQSQLNTFDGESLNPRKLNGNASFNDTMMSPTLFSPTFKTFMNPEDDRSFTNDRLNHLPVSFKLNDIKYREFIEFTGSENKERINTDFVKRAMAEDIEYLISCDPNLNNWRTHKQILQALQNSELILIDSKNGTSDHFTISDLVKQSKGHDNNYEASGKINNTCELCGNQPHHTVTPQFYYKLQLQSNPNPICTACFHRLGTAQKFFKFLSKGINRSNNGFQPHKLYFEVLQLKLDMFLARNGINTLNEIENELIRSHLLWRTND